MKIISNKKIISSITLVGFVIIIISILGGFSNTNEETKSKQKAKTEQPYIPQKVVFCNQEVPIQYFDVKESLDRELIINKYWHSNTSQLLKRANRFFPIIDSILKKNNLPLDLKYIAVIESSLQNVTSPSNAKGYWQFLEGTGLEYGLEITTQIDERQDIEKSTEAACKYLQKAYDRFGGDWFLASAGYNMGMNGLERSLQEQQVDNYFDLHLNAETARYVYRILAAKLIFENQDLYNFSLDTVDLYRPFVYDTVRIDSSIANLIEFAKINNTNLKLLKKLNPWIISNSLTVANNKSYILKIPNEHTRLNTFGKE